MSPNRTETGNRLSTATFAGGRGTTTGLIGSILLHVLIVGATLFTFAHKLDIVPAQDTPVVPVDLVTIADKTNVRAAVKQPPKMKPIDEKPVDVPQPENSEATPQPVERTEVPPPPPPKPDLVSPEPVPATPVPAIDLEKPKPQAEAKPKKEKFDIDSLSALLNKVAPAARSAPNARVANRNIKGVGAQDAMTADLVAAIQSQMYDCYTPPSGVPNPDDLVVEFDLFLNQDGSVARPPQLTAESARAAASNTYTRASAEAARRAIYECSPFKLPTNKYNIWQEINPFHFDPRDRQQ